MKCVLEDIILYDAGELDETRRAAVEAHLAQCAYCRDALAALHKIADASYGELPPPASARPEPAHHVNTGGWPVSQLADLLKRIIDETSKVAVKK